MSQASDKKAGLIELGKKLRELRDNKGKSQKEAAGDLDLKPSVLSSYEIGDREPSIITLNKIARYYNVTVDYLTDNSPYKTSEHKLLENSNILSKEAINRILNLNPSTITFLDKLLCTSEFSNFIDTLNFYKYFPHEKFQQMAEKMINEDMPAYKLGVLITANRLREDYLRKFVDESLDKLLTDIKMIDIEKEMEE